MFRAKRIISFILFSLIFFTGHAQDTYKIAYLLDEENTEVKALISGIEKEVISLVGEDARVVFPEEYKFITKFSREASGKNYSYLQNSDCDLIVCYGFVNIVSILQQQEFKKPLLFLGTLPEDFIPPAAKQILPEIPNTVFLFNSFSFKDDLKAFKSIYNYENPGIAVSSNLNANFPVDELLSDMAGGPEEYKLIVYDKPEDINSQLEGIDALYMAGGFRFGDLELKSIADKLVERRIPSFTAAGTRAVELGFLASNQKAEGMDRLIRRAALEIEAFVNAHTDQKISFYAQDDKELTINFNTAEYLGLPLRYSLMSGANVIGSLDSLVSEKRYSLKTVYEEALENNLGINSLQKDVELTAQDVKSATSAYLPDINAGVSANYTDPDFARATNGQNPEFLTAGNVRLNQVIYSPEASAGVGIRKDLKEAETERLNSEKLNLLLDASIAYFNALLLKNSLKITYSNLKVTEQNLQIAIDKYESGQSGKIDILRFESQKAQNTQQYIEAINTLKQAFFDLNQILNQPIQRRIDIDDAEIGEGIFKTYKYDTIKNILDDPKLIQPFTTFLVEEAKRNAPELRTLQFGRSAAERDYRLNTGGRFLPTVALGGQYNSIFNRSGEGSDFPAGFPEIPNSYYNLGLNVSIPLVQQNLQNINRQSATIRMEQIDLDRSNFELGIERNVNSAVLNLINQISNLELSEVSLKAANENLDLTQQAYTSGAVTYIQLIDAQTNRFQAQLANANAAYNYLLAVIRLERNIGSFFLMNTPEYTEDFNARFRQYMMENN